MVDLRDARSVLIVLDTPAAGLRSPALELLTLARTLGRTTAVALTEPSAETLASLSDHGVERVLVADLGALDPSVVHLTPVAAEAIEAALVACRADVVLFTSSFVNTEAAARLAASTRSGLVLDVAGVTDDPAQSGLVGAKRVFAGSWDVSCAVTTPMAVFTVRANAVVQALAAEPSTVEVERFAVVPTPASTAATLVDRVLHEAPVGGSGRPALAEAAYVVAGGRGTLGDFAPVEDLADALGAAVGATRDAVDEGWVGHDAQIGQTGVTIAPRVYVGAGISGAPHHRGGMQASGVIIAVNNDPDSPIFEIADFGVVGDMAEVLPQAAAEIRRHKG
ncbi:electron transfer flavoprotein subunit alpha/FixB family protein [Sanguibacter antarcticus]|uniref:Electron transfer flavoprotein alpha subunit apoprotein n=1 Tax=Sanguibacter antarcticus TaxID=372484 RepID=A0A2A9E1Y0_9MICO|nr:electron transfer flavoprotein subunit alpha/FixB family protein [Sanguibacter antarcticus]PFG32656.1 electron transfer flavoprotein alpha subunit apoprotein [Sanguibacter antarcticus]